MKNEGDIVAKYLIKLCDVNLKVLAEPSPVRLACFIKPDAAGFDVRSTSIRFAFLMC